MATTTPTAGGHTVPLQRIHVPENVRALNSEHVDALAASIALQGMLVPIVLCPAQDQATAAGFEYELVAGFHRVAAAGKLGLTDVPAVVRDSAGEQADRAVENINRLALRPDEEASAVKAMLEKGLTEDGAAQALGWPKARVTARDQAARAARQGARADRRRESSRCPPSSSCARSARSARRCWTCSSSTSTATRTVIRGRPASSSPTPATCSAMRCAKRDSKVFAAYLHQLPSHAVDELRLGKKAAEQLAEAEKLHTQVNHYAYGPPPIRFTEQDVDEARAAGVLIELERSDADHRRPAAVPRARQSARSSAPSSSCQADAERAKTERRQTAKQRTAPSLRTRSRRRSASTAGRLRAARRAGARREPRPRRRR